MKKDHVFCWVIRAQKKGMDILGRRPAWKYFARRTSIKNPRYLTTIDDNIKLFARFEEAEAFYVKKCAAVPDVPICNIIRIKVFIKKDGYWDYWKNYEAFKARDKQKEKRAI